MSILFLFLFLNWIIYLKAVPAGAVDRREFNCDADIEKVGIKERCVVAPSSPIPVASSALTEGLYFMLAIPPLNF